MSIPRMNYPQYRKARKLTHECPYGIIKTNGESRIKSRVLRFILIYFSSFSNPKFTRFSSLITVMLS